MEKYDRARQAIDDDTIRRRRDTIFVPVDLGNKPDALKIFNNFIFTWHQWLGARAPVLHYTYTACLINPLSTKLCLSDLKTHFVPRSKQSLLRF